MKPARTRCSMPDASVRSVKTVAPLLCHASKHRSRHGFACGCTPLDVFFALRALRALPIPTRGLWETVGLASTIAATAAHVGGGTTVAATAAHDGWIPIAATAAHVGGGTTVARAAAHDGWIPIAGAGSISKNLGSISAKRTSSFSVQTTNLESRKRSAAMMHSGKNVLSEETEVMGAKWQNKDE